MNFKPGDIVEIEGIKKYLIIYSNEKFYKTLAISHGFNGFLKKNRRKKSLVDKLYKKQAESKLMVLLYG